MFVVMVSFGLFWFCLWLLVCVAFAICVCFDLLCGLFWCRSVDCVVSLWVALCCWYLGIVVWCLLVGGLCLCWRYFGVIYG